MEAVCHDVFRVLPLRMTANKYVSFFVRHQSGNLMIPCYARGGLSEETLSAIEAAGGLSAQLLGDMHLKDKLCDVLHARFGAWTYCSEPEAPDVSRSVSQLRTFPFRRHELLPHVEAIPTPGHRPGGTCYLVNMGAQRVLFAADNVGFHAGRWTAYPSSRGLQDMEASLRALAECDFDYLCANTLLSEPICTVKLSNAKQRRQFFQGVIEVMHE